MPLYRWKSKKTGLEIEVLRGFKEYTEPPKGDELPADKSEEDSEWERLISMPGPINFWPASGGGPGKGNWGKR